MLPTSVIDVPIPTGTTGTLSGSGSLSAGNTIAAANLGNGFQGGDSDHSTAGSHQSFTLRQDRLLASLDIPHRNFVAPKKGVAVEFKEPRISKTLGKPPRHTKLLHHSERGSSRKLLLKPAGHKIRASSSHSRSRRRQDPFVHPWGPEAQGLQEVETLAGDTATLTKSWSTPKATFAGKRSRQKNKKGPSGVFSSVLRLKEEELDEDFDSHNIRLGIEEVRRKPGKIFEWKTPYEIDAPKRINLGKRSTTSVSSSADSASSFGEPRGLNAEQRLWEGIEALISDAFSDDDSKSHLSALADIFPSHVIKALGERSIASGDSIFSSSRGSSVTPLSASVHNRKTEDVVVPDEIEAAQHALNSFMDMLLPTGSSGRIQTHPSPRSGSNRVSPSRSRESSESEVDDEMDEIALAEVALDSFMDVLLSELEKELNSDPSQMTPEQRLHHRNKSQNTLSLFEVFRWSMSVNVDSLEKMRYIREHPDIQERVRVNRLRAQEQGFPVSDTSSSRSAQRPLQLFDPQHLVEEEEKQDSDLPSSQHSQNVETMTSLSIPIQSPEENPDPGQIREIVRMPSWIAVDGLPMVMAASRRSIGSLKSSPQSKSGTHQSSSGSGSASVLPSSFIDAVMDREIQSEGSQANGFPFETGSAANTALPPTAGQNPADNEPSRTAERVSRGQQKGWDSDMPDLQSIGSSDSTLLSNLAARSLSSGNSGMPELASISETSVQRLVKSKREHMPGEVQEVSLAEHLERPHRPRERSIQRSLSDDISRYGSDRSVLNEEGPAKSKSRTGRTDVISVGSAGDVHRLVGATLHVVQGDGNESQSHNNSHHDEITLDSELIADASRSAQHRDVPERNHNWTRAGRRRLGFGGFLADGIRSARARGKCFTKGWCPSLRQKRYSRLNTRHGGSKASSENRSEESSRQCLMHGVEDTFDRFPVHQGQMPDIMM